MYSFLFINKNIKLKKGVRMYKCAMCGGEFKEGWDDEDAKAEMKANYGENITLQDCVVICDDCYKKTEPMRDTARLMTALDLENKKHKERGEQ